MALAAAEGSLGLALTVADAYLRRNDGSFGPHLPEVPRVGGVQDPQEKRQDGKCCQGQVLLDFPPTSPSNM